jgi:protein-disulfide isomerase
VALLGSSALTIDYLSPVPTFCGATSGCGTVRGTAWSHLGSVGVPLPALGLMGFTAVLTLSLLPGTRRRAAAPVALAGGALAAALLGVQWLAIHAFCVLCVGVDMAALIAALAGAALLVASKHDPPLLESTAPGSSAPSSAEPFRDGAWIALGVLAVTAPLLWPSIRPLPDVPGEIAAYYVPGKINVVEFADFQCPWCRLYHPELKKVAAEYGDRVHLVRLDLPLAMHPLARGAARAHFCAVAQGRGEELANALFEAADLTLPGLLKAGSAVGLDPKALETCMKAPETDREVGENEKLLTRLGLFQGLPTTFVGSKMIVGAVEAPALREAFEQAAAGAHRGVPAPVYVSGVALAAALMLWFGRRRSAPPQGIAPASG